MNQALLAFDFLVALVLIYQVWSWLVDIIHDRKKRIEDAIAQDRVLFDKWKGKDPYGGTLSYSDSPPPVSRK